jgi:hypothetical protein
MDNDVATTEPPKKRYLFNIDLDKTPPMDTPKDTKKRPREPEIKPQETPVPPPPKVTFDIKPYQPEEVPVQEPQFDEEFDNNDTEMVEEEYEVPTKKQKQDPQGPVVSQSPILSGLNSGIRNFCYDCGRSIGRDALLGVGLLLLLFCRHKLADLVEKNGIRRVDYPTSQQTSNIPARTESSMGTTQTVPAHVPTSLPSNASVSLVPRNQRAVSKFMK